MFFLNPLNLIYTIFFNFRYLPIKQAIYLPIWVSKRVEVRCLKRNQLVLNKVKCGVVRLGVEGSPGMQGGRMVILVKTNGRLFFDGSAIIAIGTVLRCDMNSVIRLGDNFYCNCNCFFRSTVQINVGRDCSFGWNVILNTSDGHSVWHNSQLMKKDGPINIGNHVWVTPNTTFVKNSGVGDDSIVAQGAVVAKRFENTHCLIGGIPAKVLAQNIDWRA